MDECAVGISLVVLALKRLAVRIGRVDAHH
jgi:hypothetical protein